MVNDPQIQYDRVLGEITGRSMLIPPVTDNVEIIADSEKGYEKSSVFEELRECRHLPWFALRTMVPQSQGYKSGA